MNGKERMAADRAAGQDGLTIVLVLFFLVVSAIFATVSYRKVTGEMNGTTRNVKMAKSKYVAEAAVYIGLAVVQGKPGYTCVTHDSDGTTAATGPDACKNADLSKIPGIYAGGVTLDTGSGWLTSSPADSAEALTGTLNELIRIKIWMPSSDTVRVVGRSTVNGLSSDVQLFGNW